LDRFRPVLARLVDAAFVVPRFAFLGLLVAAFRFSADLDFLAVAFPARFLAGDAFVGVRRLAGRLLARFFRAPMTAPETAPTRVPITGVPTAVPTTAPATAPPSVLFAASF
jgi:hypothetical protein